MKASMKVTGLAEVMLALRNQAVIVPENARKVMHRYSDKIVEAARLNVPVDKHNLEDSIHKVITYSARGRLQIDIVAGGTVNGVNVDQYAIFINENYSSMKPGLATIAKMSANPGRLIGEKFLERAADEYKDQLEKAMIVAVNTEVVL